MLSKREWLGYVGIMESKETEQTMQGVDPDGMSKLAAEFAIYYARLSNELAQIKDAIDKEFLSLIGEDGKTMAMGRAEKQAEVTVNERNEVTRREIEYTVKGLDKISFACSTRVKSFSKEGNF